MPGATTQKLQDIANIIRTIFNLKDAVVDACAARIVSAVGPPISLRAAEQHARTVDGHRRRGAAGGSGFTRDKSSTTKVGTQLPTVTAFNVDQAARQS